MNIEQIVDFIVKAGLIRAILLVGGWIYVAILILVVMYYFIRLVIKTIINITK